MRPSVAATLYLSLTCFMASSAGAQTRNPEDENITDDLAPVAPAPRTNTTTAPNTAPNGNTDMIMVPRAVWEQLLRDVEALKKSRGDAPPPLESAPSLETTQPATGTGSTPVSTGGNRNYLLLPDISLILKANGTLSSDRRDSDRKRIGLSEGELGIQGYLYPGVKADAFLVGAPREDEPVQFEEGYLTFLGVRKGLNINVGRKFAPFGRTGELHSHSWLYTRQLLPIRNLVSEEALVGDGVNFNYLLPLKGKLFARTSFGIWNGEGAGEVSSNPFGQELPSGPGAGFYDRFYSARLWLGHPLGANGELELGSSYARGRSQLDDDTGIMLGRGRTTLNGVDISYRHFMNNNKRLLLRGEYFRSTPQGGLPTSRATGYYGLANFRFSKFKDIGLLYENSGFPQAPGQRENALSLILTKQLTEQFYMRLQGTRGRRPGDDNYNELRLQFIGGIGPHTHSLE